QQSAAGCTPPPTAPAERHARLARHRLERRPVRVAEDDETPALALAGDAALRRALLTAAQQAAGGALELELLLDGAARDREGEHRGAQLGLLDQRDQLAVRRGVLEGPPRLRTRGVAAGALGPSLVHGGDGGGEGCDVLGALRAQIGRASC